MPILEDAKSKQLVQKRLDSLVAVATALYSRVETSSPALVKQGIAKIEQSTSWISRPLVSKINELSQPVIHSLDNGISVVVNELETRYTTSVEPRRRHLQNKVVNSEWFKLVDSTLQRARPAVDFKAFYTAATDTLTKLKGEASSVSTADIKQYLVALESKFAGAWSEKLAVPARELFHQVEAKLKAGQGSVTEAALSARTTVRATWNTTFVANAHVLYNHALEYYRKLDHPSPAAFIAGLKIKLGQHWHDELQQPLEKFYAACKSRSTESLAKLQALPIVKRAEVISIDDMVTAVKVVGSQAAAQVRSFYSSALEYASTKVLPVEGDAGATRPSSSVTNFASRLSRHFRATVEQRITQGWGAAKELSATRIKNAIHVDPLQLAQDLLVKAEHQVGQAYHSASTQASSVTAPVTASIKRVRGELSVARHSVDERLRPWLEYSSKKLQPLTNKIHPVADSLAYNLTTVRESLSDVTQYSLYQFTHRPVLQLPHDALVLAAQSVNLHERSPSYLELQEKLNHVLRAVYQTALLAPPPSPSSIDELEAELENAKHPEPTLPAEQKDGDAADHEQEVSTEPSQGESTGSSNVSDAVVVEPVLQNGAASPKKESQEAPRQLSPRPSVDLQHVSNGTGAKGTRSKKNKLR